MPRPRVPRPILADTALLLIDRNNLLHRTAGSVDSGARRTLLARLRAGIPEDVETLVILDGTPDPGAPFRERVRRGLEVRHAGRTDADGALVAIVSARPFAERARTLVVTDDRALVERIRHVGGRTARLAELEALLAGGGAASVPTASALADPGTRAPTTPAAADARSRGPRATGSRASHGRPAPPTLGRPPSPPPNSRGDAPDAPDDADERPVWTPGRGATRKRGNPRREPGDRRPPSL